MNYLELTEAVEKFKMQVKLCDTMRGGYGLFLLNEAGWVLATARTFDRLYEKAVKIYERKK